MPKHRTKAEARGLAPATKRAKRKRATAAEQKQRAAEKEESKLRQGVFESTLMMMPFITDKRDKKGKVLRGERRDWWNVKETGEFSLDHALGEKLAVEFLRYGKKRGDPSSLLLWIINDMIEKGPEHCKNVRQGFLLTVGKVLPDGYDFDPERKQMVLLR
jgi:hypothetical protein